jgi:uncharacterized alkaline shock family protein YloU
MKNNKNTDNTENNVVDIKEKLASEKPADEKKDKPVRGQVQIADEVIASIAGTAALEVDGISSMAGGNALVDRLSKKTAQRGVSIKVDGKQVDVELNVNVLHGCKIQKAAVDVQLKVKEAIENMTGLKVCTVNINVAGIEFEKSEASLLDE